MSATAVSTSPSPFDPDAPAAYREWREAKLRCLARAPFPSVAIDDAAVPDPCCVADLRRALSLANIVHYRWPAMPAEAVKPSLRAFCARLGLHSLDHNLYADDDGIAALRVVPEGRRGEYIPYTSRAINWHTDGYYNAPGALVRAFVLHCSSDAARGGANRLLDHELVYLTMRDREPELVRALMAPDAMTIPENVEDGEVIRPRQGGPVFSTDPASGSLHLRYTARTRSIAWKDDGRTREAVACLQETLDQLADSAIHLRLRPHEGVVTNNVLHGREAFEDDPAAGKVRLYYRARFHERTAGTGLADFQRLCAGQ